jgi:hypothetical protein
MPSTVTKEELQERAQLVRIHEANCGIEHPTEEQQRFTSVTMRALADCFGFKALRDKEITGPLSRALQTQKPK